MSRPCTICGHKDQLRLEAECAAGRFIKPLAKEFGVSYWALKNHWDKHVTPSRRAELIAGPAQIAQLAKKAAAEDRSLLDYLSILRSELFDVFLECKRRGLTYDAANVAQRILNVLDAIGKLTGQLRQAGITINNVGQINQAPPMAANDPQVVKLQSTIIRALAPYPEARDAVVGALRALELEPAVVPARRSNGHGAPLIEAKPVETK